MQIFISYSHEDIKIVSRIIDRLTQDGHSVWIDTLKLQPGDNILQKIEQAIENAEVFIPIVSENSFRSNWVQKEFSAIGLRQISNDEKIIIPIRLDDSPVPDYFKSRIYLDFSQKAELGMELLSSALLSKNTKKVGSIFSQGAASDELENPNPVNRNDSSVEHYDNEISNLNKSLRDGRLTLMCGAGVSVPAGIPNWDELLISLLNSMMERIAKNKSLELGTAAADEFHKRFNGSSLILGKYLKNTLGRDFPEKVRQAIYNKNPKSCSLIDSIVELSRPQREGHALDSIITFNFDCLIEENLKASGIRNKAIYSEAIEHDSNELPIFHVHGYLPRKGRIPSDSRLVFSEDGYHSQFIEPYSWANLIQLNKLTQNTCLFVGISLTDPNMRRLLDVAWRKNSKKSAGHYIFKRRPRFDEGDTLKVVFEWLEEQDARELGLNIIWVNDYAEIPPLIYKIANSL